MLRYYVVEFFFFGVVAANGVVIATEKKLPSILVDESSVSKHLLFFYWFCYILWFKFKKPFCFFAFFFVFSLVTSVGRNLFKFGVNL